MVIYMRDYLYGIYQNVIKKLNNEFKSKNLNKKEIFYNGRVETYALMAFFADHMVSQSLMFFGQLFQTLQASLRNVDCTIEDLPNSFRS